MIEIMEVEERSEPMTLKVQQGESTCKNNRKCKNITSYKYWKAKYIRGQQQLARYEMELANCKTDLIQAQKELGSYKKLNKKLEERETALSTDLEAKEATLAQLRDFSSVNASCEKDLIVANKKLASMTKAMKKRGNFHDKALEQIKEQKKIIHVLKRKNKKLMAHLMTLCNMTHDRQLSKMEVAIIESVKKTIRLFAEDINGNNNVSLIEEEITDSTEIRQCLTNNDLPHSNMELSLYNAHREDQNYVNGNNRSVSEQDVKDCTDIRQCLTNSNLLHSIMKSSADIVPRDASTADINTQCSNVSLLEQNQIFHSRSVVFNPHEERINSSTLIININAPNELSPSKVNRFSINSTNSNEKPEKTIVKFKKPNEASSSKLNVGSTNSTNSNEKPVKTIKKYKRTNEVLSSELNIASTNGTNFYEKPVKTIKKYKNPNEALPSELIGLSICSTNSNEICVKAIKKFKKQIETLHPELNEVPICSTNSDEKSVKTIKKYKKPNKALPSELNDVSINCTNSKEKLSKAKKTQSHVKESNCTIENALQNIKNMAGDESKYISLKDNLVNALMNPDSTPNTTSALYQLFSFLSSSISNFLNHYVVEQNISVFYPPAENCIVEAIIETGNKKESHLEKLIPSAIHSLYYLILDKNTLSKSGLGALCRVFTHLCKRVNDEEKPISLACDLIKEQHPQAPVAIAFIIGIWTEIFEQSRDKTTFSLLLLSSIFLCLKKRPPTVSKKDWKACNAVFQLPYAVPLPSNLKDTTRIIISKMQKLINEPPDAKDVWPCDILLMLASAKGWEWTQEHVLPFVTTSLFYYAKKVNHERAFSFFADLCADIGKLAPNGCLTILDALTTLFEEDNEFDYVKKHSAGNLMKLLLFTHAKIPAEISEYVEVNACNLFSSKVVLYLKRRVIADSDELTENDIFLV